MQIVLLGFFLAELFLNIVDYSDFRTNLVFVLACLALEFTVLVVEASVDGSQAT